MRDFDAISEPRRPVPNRGGRRRPDRTYDMEYQRLKAEADAIERERCYFAQRYISLRDHIRKLGISLGKEWDEEAMPILHQPGEM